MNRSAWKAGIVVAHAVALMSIFSKSAWAQTVRGPKTEISASFGLLRSESIPDHRVFGGSYAHYFSDHGYVGPEFLYMRASAADQDFYLHGLVGRGIGKPSGKINGNISGGYGLGYSKPNGTDSGSNKGPSFAGVRLGIKVYVTPRVFVSGELGFIGIDAVLLLASGGYVLQQR